AVEADDQLRALDALLHASEQRALARRALEQELLEAQPSGAVEARHTDQKWQAARAAEARGLDVQEQRAGGADVGERLVEREPGQSTRTRERDEVDVDRADAVPARQRLDALPQHAFL